MSFSVAHKIRIGNKAELAQFLKSALTSGNVRMTESGDMFCCICSDCQSKLTTVKIDRGSGGIGGNFKMSSITNSAITIPFRTQLKYNDANSHDKLICSLSLSHWQ